MSRFKINSWVRKNIKQMSRGKEFVRESKHQLSKFHFGSENPNLSTNVGLFFRPSYSVLWLIVKQSVLMPFLAILHRMFGLQKGSPLGLATSVIILLV